MASALKGRKSSSSTSRKATRHDDTLFGQDTVEALLAISEGPIQGPSDGAATFFVGDIPLLDKGTQTPNISNFELRFLKGTNPADSIRLNLGGIASTKNIGLDLRTVNQQIVAQGDKTQIDYIDLRFVVSRLLLVSAEGGEFPAEFLFKVEVKPRSSNTWQIPFDNQDPPPVENTSGASNYRPGASAPGTLVNDAYRETYMQSAAPAAAKARGAIWFDTTNSVNNPDPKIWNGTAWVAPTNLTTITQSGYTTRRWTDFDGAIRTAWMSPGGAAPPPGALARGDYLVTPSTGEQIYSYNDTAWVGFQNWASPIKQAPGVIRIYGLTRSSYPKEYRIPVARINEPYDVRVTRLTGTSTKTMLADANFESIQEVNKDLLSFPDLAVAWLTIKATDTFTSIPEFTGIYKGLIIPVPTNYTYDDTTKSGTYSGVWDGSFKMAYTNNPAWHAYNFIMNSRYGKNSYYPEIADKWDYYEFGKHCDLHKLRFNEYITEARPLNELINYVVGIAGGRYVDRGDGYSTVIWDADDQPAQAIFAPENVIDGNFTYSFTDITERKNDFKVSFKNPQLNYREDRLRVYDQNSIDIQGRNAEEFVAVGCRDAEEAVRRGRLRLATALTEKTIVNFKTNRIGRYLLPFQVILVSDPTSSNVISGRIKNPDPLPSGTTVLPLRDQIYLESGIAYSVQFTVSDGNGGLKVVSYPLTVNTAGQQTQLRLTNALTEPLTEYAVFSIGSPKPYRVTSIAQDDNNGDILDITAIEVNRQKWAFVDGLVELRDILALQTGPLSRYIFPVTNASITPELTTDGRYHLVAKWNPSETKLIRGYRVYQSIDTGPMELVGEPSETTFRVADVRTGTYLLSIVAVSMDGQNESAPVTVQYIVTNASSLRSVTAPSNLRLVDEPEAPIFRAINPRFTWDAAIDPLVSRYVVEVLNGSNQVVSTQRVEGQLIFTYSLAANRADNGGTPLRQFTVRVRSIDQAGNLSLPISLVVSHPAPAVITLTTSAVSETVFINYTAPGGDFQGVLIWMETVSGFNPLTTTPKYDGSNTFIPLPATKETTYYIRGAGYDSYGKTGLNISAEQVQRASILLFDPSAPTIPGTPTLTSTAEPNANDGTLTARVNATWAASTGNFADLYEVACAEGGGNFITELVNGPAWEKHGFRPNIQVQVKVRAVSKEGFAVSGYSPVGSITTVRNTAAPANPTAVTVTSGFERAFINWTAPVTVDLKHIEVHAFIGNSTAAAPPTGSSLIARVGKGTTFYQDPTLATTGTETYWLRSISTSDVAATSYVRAGVATSGALEAAQLKAGIIDATKVAAGLEIPGVVSSLPNPSGYTGPKTVFNSGDGKLYRYVNGAWTASVPTGDLVGQITDAQIAALAATKISGQLTDGQLGALSTNKLVGQIVANQVANAAITLDKFGAGLKPIAETNGLPSVSGYTGPKVLLNTADGKLYRLIGEAWVTSVTASDISGQLAAGQIAALEASKITGQLTSAQIAALDAAKVSGQLTDAQLAGISAGKLTGTIVSNQIADAAVTLDKFATGLKPVGEVSALPNPSGYTGPKVVLLTTDGKVYRLVGSTWTTSVTAGDISGQLGAAQVAALEASKITGQLTNDQLAAIDASKIAGQLTNTQIAGVDASKVTGAAGSLSGNLIDKLSAGQLITAGGAALFINDRLSTASLTGTLAAAQIADNTIASRMIAAGAVLASKLILTDLTNIVPNSTFEGGSLDRWTVPAGFVAVPSSSDLTPPGAPTQFTGYVPAPASGVSTVLLGTDFIPVVPGESYHLSTTHAMLAGTTAVARLGIQTFNAAKGGGLNNAPLTVTPTTSWVTSSVLYTIPAGVFYVRPSVWIAGNAAEPVGGVGFTNVRMRKAVNAELIVDGAVVARSIAAHQISAKHLTLTDTDNLCFNGDFAQGLDGWERFVGSVVASSSLPAGAPARQGIVLTRTTTEASTTFGGNFGTSDEGGVSVQVGDQLYAEMWCHSTVAGTAPNDFLVRNPAGTLTNAPTIKSPTTLAANTWTKVTFTMTVTVAGKLFLRLFNLVDNSVLTITGVRWNRRNAASLIVDGSIVANQLAVNSVTARQIALADFQNLLANGDFAQGVDADWTLSHPGSTSLATITDAGTPARTCATIAATATNMVLDGGFGSPCGVGDQFYWELWARSTDASATAYAQLLITRATDQVIAGSGSTILTLPAGVWTKFSGTFTANFIGRARLRLAKGTANTQFQFTAVRFQRMNGAELTVDGSISARKLLIGSTMIANMLSVGEFVDGRAGWSWSATDTRFTVLNDGAGPSGTPYLRLDRAVTDSSVSLNTTALDYIPVEGSTVYEALAYFRGSAASAAGAYLRVLWYDAAKAATTVPGTGGAANAASYTDSYLNGPFTTSWVKRGQNFTSPAAARFARIQIYHHNTSTAQWMDVASITMRRAMTGTMIENGTITTTQIAARTITANNLVSNTITANEIAASTITATQIAARTITANNLVSNTITANEIAANTITATQIAANTITATQIAVGTITATEIATGTISTANLAAGVITADKIAVGLNAGNLLFNSDGLANTVGIIDFASTQSGIVTTFVGQGDTNAPVGMGAIVQVSSGAPNGTYSGMAWGRPLAAGGSEVWRPVQPGKRYELSAYINCYRSAGADVAVAVYDGAKQLIADQHSSRTNVVSTGTLQQWPRVGLFFTMPGNAAYAVVYVRTYFNGGSNPTTFASGLYFGIAQPNQTAFSDWAPGASTLIDGGSITTNSITANQIAANTITATQIAASTITAGQIAASTITATQIAANTITATQIAANTITAGQIAASTITATQIASRTITAANLVAGTITATEIAANTITAGQIAASTITATQITANTITAGQIAANTITAGQIAASTITATQIAARTIAASNIVSNTITGNEIQAASVNADRLVANSITATQIAARTITATNLVAGTVTATEIAAGSIVGSKLAIASYNLIFNSNGSQVNSAGTPLGAALGANNTNLAGTITSRLDNAFAGTTAFLLRMNSQPASGTVADIVLRSLDANPATAGYTRAQPGLSYEVSAYVAGFECGQTLYADWIDVNGGGLGRAYTSAQQPTNRGLVRIGGFTNVAPANTVGIAIAIRAHWNGGANFHLFVSAPMFSPLVTGQSELSPYVDSGVTLVDGTSIRTGSLTANKIVANSITSGQIQAGAIGADQIAANAIVASKIAADAIVSGKIAANAIGAREIAAGSITTGLLQAASINVDTIAASGSISADKLAATVLTAGNITVGTAQLSSWVSGADQTKINGGSIAANSITTNSLRIGSRNVQLVGISFYSERDANGVQTNVIGWTAGFVLIVNDNGDPQSFSIPASRVGVDAGNWYIYWDKTNGSNFQMAKDNWPDVYRNSNMILMATVSNVTGISTLIGSTIIDGTRITTRSIQADQIAANQIQTAHMSANSINGDRITAGTLSADKISTGTLTASRYINLGNGKCQIVATDNGGIFRCTNNDGTQWRFAAGDLTEFTQGGDFGMIAWAADGSQAIKIASTGAYINGAVIGTSTIGSTQIADAAITNAKITNLSVDNAKITNLTISTGKIQNNAISQLLSESSDQREAQLGITVRAGSKIIVKAYFNGNSRSGNSNGAGDFIIYRDGNAIKTVPASFSFFVPGSGAQLNYPSSMAIAVLDNPGEGNHVYRCFHSNGQNVGGVLIEVLELLK